MGGRALRGSRHYVCMLNENLWPSDVYIYINRLVKRYSPCQPAEQAWTVCSCKSVEHGCRNIKSLHSLRSSCTGGNHSFQPEEIVQIVLQFKLYLDDYESGLYDMVLD